MTQWRSRSKRHRCQRRQERCAREEAEPVDSYQGSSAFDGAAARPRLGEESFDHQPKDFKQEGHGPRRRGSLRTSREPTAGSASRSLPKRTPPWLPRGSAFARWGPPPCARRPTREGSGRLPARRHRDFGGQVPYARRKNGVSRRFGSVGYGAFTLTRPLIPPIRLPRPPRRAEEVTQQSEPSE
jgi:hypothetical protein